MVEGKRKLNYLPFNINKLKHGEFAEDSYCFTCVFYGELDRPISVKEWEIRPNELPNLRLI